MTDATKRPAVRLSLLGAALLLCPLLTSAAGRAQETAGTYTNPVSKGFADTFASPSIIKAKDGYGYSYGTSSRAGENFVWGGTWTLLAGTKPRIGPLSLGENPNDPAATSRFDYFRVYRP